MKIILYGKKTEQMKLDEIQCLINVCCLYADKIFIYRPFFADFCNSMVIQEQIVPIDSVDEVDNADFMISIGGDGTFLSAANFVGRKKIALLGINMGRLGFLSNLQSENLPIVFQALKDKNYTLERRMLLQCTSSLSNTLTDNLSFALNDVCFHRTDDSDMIVIDVKVAGKHLNTYWGDGLIVSTPTGSTAYSLSCGGPIVYPTLEVFLLSPIASHALTVRPIIVPASQLEIHVKSRTGEFLLSKDSDTMKCSDNAVFTIEKANFFINMVKLAHQNFYKTISEKLMWGADKRFSML